MFSNPELGVCDSSGVFYCSTCSVSVDSCGSVFALDLCSADCAVTVCAGCGVDVLERDDLQEWLARPIGWQSVVHADVVLCPSCFSDVCDPRCQDDHDVVTLGDGLRWVDVDHDRRCAVCRDLLFW